MLLLRIFELSTIEKPTMVKLANAVLKTNSTHVNELLTVP